MMIANTAMIPPMVKLPVSPINTWAGKALYQRKPIRTACMLAQAKDVILVAGKGHENYQEIKGIKHHFDDKEVLRDIFANE